MSWRVVLGALLALPACGRIGFDAAREVGDGGSDASGDGGADGPMIDASSTGLHLNIPFENIVMDIADGRTVACDGSMCPTFTLGRNGGMAGSFDGTVCLIVPNAAVFRSQAFTLSLWMRTPGGGSMTLFGKPYLGATMGENSWEIWKNNSNGIRFDTSPGGQANGNNISLNTWHHIAGTFENGMLKVYVDGTREQTVSGAAIDYADDPIRIGCDVNVGVVNGYFIGDLDDVLFYDRALSAAEIAALAQ